MKLMISVLAIAGAVTVPAVAQEATMDPATMTCADYAAMDTQGQMQAMVALQSSLSGQVTGDVTDEVADDAMVTGEATATDDTADDAMATEDMAATDDAMATEYMAATDDAMATDEAMPAEGAEEVATGETAEGSEGGSMAADDPMMAAMMAACEGSPDMMATDAMTTAMGN